MQKEAMNKFLSAIKAAGMTKWDAVCDIPTHYHHDGERRYNYYDGEETLVNFRGSLTTSTPIWGDPIQISVADISDIHEVTVGGTIEQVKKFCENFGIEMDDELKSILVKIQSANSKLIPETGDYTFRILSKKEIEKLSPEDKEKYESDLKEYNKRMMPGPIQVN